MTAPGVVRSVSTVVRHTGSTGTADSTLAALGWDDRWRTAYDDSRAASGRLEALAGGPTEPGRITRTDRAGGDVLTAGGLRRATWGGDLLAESAYDVSVAPTTGDWVRLQHWADGRVTAEAVLPRRTSVVRASASASSRGQVLAANIDHVAVVESLVPEPQRSRVERLLALAWDSGASPHVVLTKADLCTDGPEIATELGPEIAPGVPVHVLAIPRGDGLAELRELCAGGATLALLGGSGAGKSTLVNALTESTVMATQELATIGKGRHTTVTRELHVTPGGGCVLDTPGLRGVGLQGDGGLDEVFADVAALARGCRFADCAHESEPGCAVLAAVEAGELPERRLANWRKLQREAAWSASREDARLRQARLREWKVITKAVRQGQVRP